MAEPQIASGSEVVMWSRWTFQCPCGTQVSVTAKNGDWGDARNEASRVGWQFVRLGPGDDFIGCCSTQRALKQIGRGGALVPSTFFAPAPKEAK